MSKRWVAHSLALAVTMAMSPYVLAQDAPAESAQDAQQGAQQAPREHKGHRGMKGAKSGKSMDAMFVKKAASGGMAEVELGNLAKDKGSSDAVKQFAERMVTDHGKANDELKSLAGQKNWTMPDEMMPEHKKHRDMLEKMSGADFDRAYMREMMRDHRKDVASFRRCAQNCTDPDLKAWAQKTLPILEEHAKLARETGQQVGVTQSAAKGARSKKDGDASAPTHP